MPSRHLGYDLRSTKRFQPVRYFAGSCLTFYYLDTTYLRNYRHEYVLKRIATDAGLAGDIIPQNLMSSGNEFVRTYTISSTVLTGPTRVSLFRRQYGTSGTTHRIENEEGFATSAKQSTELNRHGFPSQ